MTSSSTDKALVERQVAHQSDRLAERIGTVADDLRAMALDVERVAERLGSPRLNDETRFSHAAEEVGHILAWGFANIGAHRLITPAAELDQLRLRLQEGE